MPLLKKLQPAARAIIWNQMRDSILLVKRQDLPVWELPGGGIEPDETPEKAVIREILEETGLTIQTLNPVGIYYPLCRLASLSYTFECMSYTGIPTISEESADIAFFPIDRLPKHLPPPYPDWIKDAKQKRRELIVKAITSVTYKALIGYLIGYPKLVLSFLKTRMPIFQRLSSS